MVVILKCTILSTKVIYKYLQGVQIVGNYIYKRKVFLIWHSVMLLIVHEIHSDP